MKGWYLVMADMGKMANKLVTALNTKGYKLLLNYKQFLGADEKVRRYYTVNQATWNPDKQKYESTQIYGSPSNIRIVLFLRDMWCEANGQELPTDNEMWNKIREEIRKGEQ